MRSAWVLLAATVISLPAAADNEVYGGVGLGFASIEIDVAGTDLLDIDGTAFAYRAFAGWRFLKYVALEAGYQTSGEVEGTFTTVLQGPGGLPTAFQEDVDVELSSIDLSIIGRFPLNDSLEVYGQVGWTSWDLDFSFAQGGSSDFDDENLIYAIGANFFATDNWVVGLQARLDDIDTKSEGFDTSTYSVLAHAFYRFDLAR